jgi:hypothetical protein
VREDQIALLSEEDRRHLCELDWERSAVLLAPGCYLNHACDPPMQCDRARACLPGRIFARVKRSRSTTG